MLDSHNEDAGVSKCSRFPPPGLLNRDWRSFVIDGQDHFADAEALGFPRLAESVVPLDIWVI